MFINRNGGKILIREKSQDKKEEKEKEKEPICCMTCDHYIILDEGGAMCDADAEPVLLMDEWETTDDYFWCGGSEYESEEDDD